MREQILQGKYDYPSPYCDLISPSARDLIDSLLTVDPTKRLTAEAALEHPWMKEEVCSCIGWFCFFDDSNVCFRRTS